jgi:hypothetical protein
VLFFETSGTYHIPSWSLCPSQDLTIAVHTICLVSGSLERGCVIYTCDRWFCWSSLASADGQLAALPIRRVVCRVRLLDLTLRIQRCRNKPTTVQSTQNTKARIMGASDPWMQLVEMRGVASTAIAGLRGTEIVQVTQTSYSSPLDIRLGLISVSVSHSRIQFRSAP